MTWKDQDNPEVFNSPDMLWLNTDGISSQANQVNLIFTDPDVF